MDSPHRSKVMPSTTSLLPMASNKIKRPHSIITAAKTETQEQGIAISFVIPVFNGSKTIQRVVEDIWDAVLSGDVEIILVNDGSTDLSETVCRRLVDVYPGHVGLVQLTRNYGEHNAVMAGLRQARGEFVAILDDDGQQRAVDALRMVQHASAQNLDVVFGRYPQRRHSPLRIMGSWITDRTADYLLKKPRGLYLSSFKVLNRFVIDEVCKYTGPRPYLDGLILRVTKNLGQIEVEHQTRLAGRSGYTMAKLMGLWLDIFVGYSIVPLRLSIVAGLLSTFAGLVALVLMLFTNLDSTQTTDVGIAWIGATVALVTGIQLVSVGILGEYVGRLHLQQSAMPQYIVRYKLQTNETVMKMVDAEDHTPRNRAPNPD